MPATVHVKRRLTNLSVHYPPDFKEVGTEFFPTMPVEYLTDQFAVQNKASLLAMQELTPLGDDDAPPDLELKWDADSSFTCQVYGLQSPGKWVTERNADPSLDYETERTIQLTLALRLRLEYLRTQKLRSASLMNTSTLSAAQRFDNYTSGSSKPISTLRLTVNTIGYANQGRKPNRIAATTYVWQAIANSEEFKDLVKYNVVQSVREAAERSENGYIALIESLIGVAPGTIMVSDAVYNVAASNQTAIYTTFMGPDIVLGYVEPWGLRKYSLGAGFQWSAYSNDPQAIIAVPRYHNTVVPTEDLRVFTVIDPEIVVKDLGYCLKGCINGADTTSYGQLVNY